MAYVVVMCPGCYVALVADDDNETTSCNRCGDRLTLSAMRVFRRTDAHDEAVRVAGAVNARRDGELEAFLETVDGDAPDVPATPIERAIAETEGRSGRDRARAALVVLAEEVELTAERARELLERLDVDPETAADDLERLAKRGDLYEPRPGVYRRSPPG